MDSDSILAVVSISVNQKYLLLISFAHAFFRETFPALHFE